MTSETQEQSAISERLERVERQNRNLKRGMIAVVAMLLFAGIALPVKQTFSQGDVVEAQSFILRDAAGNMRALWTEVDGEVALGLFDAGEMLRTGLIVDVDGNSRLEFYDAGGTQRIGLGTWDGAPSLTLYDTTGNHRVGLAVGVTGDAQLEVYDGYGAQRISFGTWDGAPGVLLGDSNETIRALFELNENGEPGLTLFDTTGNHRVGLFVNIIGDVQLEVYDAGGTQRIALGTWDGAPGMLFADSNETERALFELTDAGEPALSFYNRNGDVSWAAPGR